MSNWTPDDEESQYHTEGNEPLYYDVSDYMDYSSGVDPTDHNHYGQQAYYYSNSVPGESSFDTTHSALPAPTVPTVNPTFDFNSNLGYPGAMTPSYDPRSNH